MFGPVRARGFVVTIRATVAHADRVLLSPWIEARYTGQMVTVVKRRPASMEVSRLRQSLPASFLNHLASLWAYVIEGSLASQA